MKGNKQQQTKGGKMKKVTKQRYDWSLIVRKLSLEKKRQFAAYAAAQVVHISSAVAADGITGVYASEVADYSATDYNYDSDESVAAYASAAAEAAVAAAYAVADSDAAAAEMEKTIINYGISLI